MRFLEFLAEGAAVAAFLAIMWFAASAPLVSNADIIDWIGR